MGRLLPGLRVLQKQAGTQDYIISAVSIKGICLSAVSRFLACPRFRDFLPACNFAVSVCGFAASVADLWRVCLEMLDYLLRGAVDSKRGFFKGLSGGLFRSPFG
jgi:hypothetical protein